MRAFHVPYVQSAVSEPLYRTARLATGCLYERLPRAVKQWHAPFGVFRPLPPQYVFNSVFGISGDPIRAVTYDAAFRCRAPVHPGYWCWPPKPLRLRDGWIPLPQWQLGSIAVAGLFYEIGEEAAAEAADWLSVQARRQCERCFAAQRRRFSAFCDRLAFGIAEAMAPVLREGFDLDVVTTPDFL